MFFFLSSLCRERNSIACHVRNNLSRRVSGFHHPYRADLRRKELKLDDCGICDCLAFGVAAIWNIKSCLFIERHRPQVFLFSLGIPAGHGSKVQGPSGKWRRSNTKH